jgi:23S rRNA (pseudouridine1915-N3)-methyltransferase
VKISVIVVGRAGVLVADGIAEYERRAGRYWNLEVIEVKEERARKGLSEEQVRGSESARLLDKVQTGVEIIALTPDGKAWSSEQLARYLEQLGVHGRAGAAFIIGGALGLSAELLQRADRTLSLSAMTLTHEMARLVLTEQLYRAGTIMRGEPYHKGKA